MVSKLKKASIEIRQNKNRDMSPNWDGAASWNAEQFNKHFNSSMAWYRVEKSGKELKPKVIDWMGRNGYDKDTIAAFKKTKDSRCSMTVGSIAACLLKGMPEVHKEFNNGKNSAEWLRSQIQHIIDEGTDDIDDSETIKTVTKEPSQVVSIQDRIREQAGASSEELDAAIDAWIMDPESFDPKAFKIINLLRGKSVKGGQSRYIKSYFQSTYNELLELANGSADEQLREAYRHNSRKNVKKLIEFYESIMTACDQIAAEAKIMKKPRTKKVKPAEDQIKKMKFCMKDDKLSIVSVSPVGIIGAQGLVTYNIKTRKIGYIISKSSTGLGVKGTTLINFSEKSFQKTLRNPSLQLKEFKEQNTQKRFETWFNKTIKTTETKHTGRINEDTIILKIYK